MSPAVGLDFRAIRCRDSGNRTTAGLHCLTDIPVTAFDHRSLRRISARDAK